MSYFPEDIPFMSKEELRENGIRIPKDVPDTNVGDTISRQAAIDALKNDMSALDHIIKGMSGYDVRLDAYVSQRNQVDCDIDTISNLPPAQPKQRMGKWILGDMCSVKGYWVTCSVCGHTSFGGGNFCRECGAKMGGNAE